MTVSAITLLPTDTAAARLSAFNLGGVLHALWPAPGATGARRLCWAPHDGTTLASIVRSAVSYPAIHVTGRVRADGKLVVAFDDAEEPMGDTGVWVVVLDPLTGSEVSSPVLVAFGARPVLVVLPAGAAEQLVVIYRRLDGAPRLRVSDDGGGTWGDDQPVLNGKVAETDYIAAAEANGRYVSVLQVGNDARRLREQGNIRRTRPMAACVFDATSGLFVVESAVRTGQITDHLRGRVLLDGAGNLITTSRARQGADDGAGDLLRYDVSGVLPKLQESVVLAAGGTPGGEIVRAPMSPLGSGAVIYTVPDTTAIVDLALLANHVFFAAYGEAPAAGLAGWVNLATLASGTFALGAGVTRVGAVGAGLVVTTGVVAFGYTDGGAEYLKVGVFADPPSGMVFSAAHAMPGRVTALLVVLNSTTDGWVYAGYATGVNVYRFTGVTNPLRLQRSYTTRGLGEVRRLTYVGNGNVVAAMARGGVAVLGPEGEVLAQRLASTFGVPVWRPSRVVTIGDMARPTDGHRYAPQRRYFTCTRSGTTGTTEPLWAPTGTVNDPSAAGAGWAETGVLESDVTDVAYYSQHGKLFGVGLTGGSAATTGRVFIFDSAGLIMDPPQAQPVTFNVVDGASGTDPIYLEMISDTPNAEIHYTTDGTAPDLTSPLYAGAVPFETTGTFFVRAVAYAPNHRPSRFTAVGFSIDLPDLPLPKITPIAELLVGPVDFLATLYHDLPGVTIRYTTDGSDPTLASPVFDPESPFHVTDRFQIKAKAWKALYDPSAVATFDYTVVTPMVPRSVGDSLSHILIASGAPYDLNSNAWDMQGIVPSVAYATVLGTKKAEGIGPFTDANWYKLRGSEVDVDALDVAGDFTATLILRGGGDNDGMFCNGISNVSGYRFVHSTSGAGRASLIYGGVALHETGASILDGNVHVVSFGRTGNTLYLKVDDRPVRSTAAPGTHTIGTNRAARIGRDESTGLAHAGTFHELRFLSTGLTAAQYDALHAAILA